MARGSKAVPAEGTLHSNLVYDIVLWLFTVITDLFFREIHPRSSWKIPRRGPVIFVGAPHANQFVDPLILMRTVRHDAGRRIAFLIAEKSMRRRFVGFLAGLMNSVSVGRAMDSKKSAQGKIRFKSLDEQDVIEGLDGADFTSDQFMKSGLLVLPSVNSESANAEIAEIRGPTEILLKKPFKGEVAFKQLTGQDLDGPLRKDVDLSNFGGTKFSVAPHVDQSAVYDSVFRRMEEGGCIGIFPEGGSHDRTELLPLKAGVAIMALGALANNPDCGVTIVPVGMNYFHAHKFRSRAVIEFGGPVEVEPRLVEMYKSGDRRTAIGELLDVVYNSLVAVTVTSPDYDTLMLIQAVRRLYNPKGKKLPLPMIVELNRRLVRGYTTYKEDPRIVSLKRDVLRYNRQLLMLNIRDHQVSYAKFSWHQVVLTLIYRVLKLAVLAIAVVPGTFLFSPVFIAGKLISIRKSREALAASTVKIQARDVVATWKILVAMAFAPALYNLYAFLLAYWNYRSHVSGLAPTWMPWWLIIIAGWVVFPAMTFASLRFGEIGMDIVKSLRPLVLSLNPSSGNTLEKLRRSREGLVDRITEVIEELGPELYPDFAKYRLVPTQSNEERSSDTEEAEPQTPKALQRDGMDHLTLTPSMSPPPTLHRKQNSAGTNRTSSLLLPRNDSFKNIGSIGLFASRPGTPSRSRSRTNSSEGFKLGGLGFGFTKIADRGLPKTQQQEEEKKSISVDMEDVSKRIQEGMRERSMKRRKQRRRSSGEDSWIMEGGSDSESDGVGDGQVEELVVEEGRKYM
ncbi:hypothetical protein K431DRAFT_285852 [Polychaeton citri CBS 116435]|uniref:Phospholipid/glycerol acyltransferase domain-containing protein n=1 Tax=Polychaeton citri CBS 116435 TaxID=1314669 RepID=A0A9P4Q6U5_9PEZI|nr:hypothetical protein K431DRAFT_285852 [Polychaeton citri CBS 116435]